MMINYRLVSRYLGILMAVTSLLMLVPMPWALYFNEYVAILDLAFAMLAGLALGALFYVLGRNASSRITQRDALLLVCLSWILVSAVGALPFVISGDLSPVDAYFESMSGFTTTGSSVWTDLDNAPRTLVFWRSFTHWIGGLGLVLLMTAILPNLGTSIKQFVLRETTGPDPRAFRPTIRQTASILYKVYLALTVIGTIGLLLAGYNLFESLNYCFSALATGGFSTQYASVAGYDNFAAEVVLILIMLAGAINFTIYYDIARGNWLEAFRRNELRWFLAIYMGITVLVTLNLAGMENEIPMVRSLENSAAQAGKGVNHLGTFQVQRDNYDLGHSLRLGAFQVATMMTTTGFVIDNYDEWPYLSRYLLMLSMWFGGCAGSTAGGMKIIRIFILAQVLWLVLERAFRPYIVRTARLHGQPLSEETQQRVLGFFLLYVTWMVFSTAVLSVMGMPLESAASATFATVNNCGPGLELVGPATDYGALPDLTKLFLAFNMLVGRLELVTVLALFMPGFWKRE